MQRLKMSGKGPNGNYRRGQIVEVDDERAAILLDGGHARPADEPEEVIEDASSDEECQTLP